MAFTRDSIKKLGITDDEVITKILDAHHAEFDPIKDKADQYDAEKERADTLKADYDEQSKSIEALKASVGNTEALEKQIKDLQDTAAAKDAEHQKALDDMQTRLDNTEFDKLLDTAITKAGGRRSASIRAELNIDDLKASKNRSSDIEEAIKALKEADDTAFLFTSSVAEPTGARVDSSGNAGNGTGGTDTKEAAARAVMGLTSIENGKEK